MLDYQLLSLQGFQYLFWSDRQLLNSDSHRVVECISDSCCGWHHSSLADAFSSKRANRIAGLDQYRLDSRHIQSRSNLIGSQVIVEHLSILPVQVLHKGIANAG